MKKTGVGIIGCGNISSTYLELSKTFTPFEIRAVADINSDAAVAKSSEFGVDARSVDELLASTDISIILNLTFPDAHFEVTKNILKADKHAFSEKPLSLSLTEAQELQSLSSKLGLRVGCAPDTFLGGAHQKVRQAIDEGQIGRVITGTCHIMGHGHESWHPNPDFYYLLGGGPVFDMGPYYITNLVQLLGPVRVVTAMSSLPFTTRTIGSGDRMGDQIEVEVPTTYHSTLEFHSGAIVTLSASWDVWAHKHDEFELYGETGSVFVPDPNYFGGIVRIVDQHQNITDYENLNHVFGQPNVVDQRNINRANYRGLGLADMCLSIGQERPHRCSLELAAHVVDVMTSIMRSADERSWVETTTMCERPAPLTVEQAKQLIE